MDRFFTQDKCDRCYKNLKDGRTMSMFNLQCICMECAEKERGLSAFTKAQESELEEVRKGNLNFKGIGFPEEK